MPGPTSIRSLADADAGVATNAAASASNGSRRWILTQGDAIRPPGARRSALAAQPASIARRSSSLSSISSAAMLSRRCSTDRVPGIGTTQGARWSSQAILI